MLPAVVGRERSAAFQCLCVNDQCDMAVDDVGKRTLPIIHTGMFCVRIVAGGGSILGLAAFWTVTATRKPVMQRGIQCSPVCPPEMIFSRGCMRREVIRDAVGKRQHAGGAQKKPRDYCITGLDGQWLGAVRQPCFAGQKRSWPAQPGWPAACDHQTPQSIRRWPRFPLPTWPDRQTAMPASFQWRHRCR